MTTQADKITVSVSQEVYALMKRYMDAYHVAESIISTGTLIKGLGIVVGLMFAVGGLYLCGQQAQQGQYFLLLGIFVLTVGTVCGMLIYLIGIHVSAQGQLLLANIDTAVNSSPMLTNEQRARVMSIDGNLKYRFVQAAGDAN